MTTDFPTASLGSSQAPTDAVEKSPSASNTKIRTPPAVDSLAPEDAAKLLLTILHDDMKRIVERYVTGQRQLIVATFENWWDKYKVTLTEIERDRDAAASQLQQFLKGLKYV
jgi:hypothetical protein